MDLHLSRCGFTFPAQDLFVAMGATSAQGAVQQSAPPPSPSLSGPEWTKRFMGTTDIEDLDPAFKPKMKAFIEALTEAGATMKIASVYRPPERAFLMHWSWRIATQGYDPRKVPKKQGVEIDWWHGDLEKSREAAAAMVKAYRIRQDLKVAPSTTSNHSPRKAVDMDVAWTGSLTIKDAKGKEVVIKSTPRDATNADLIKVAATFGVIHYKDVMKDKNHWSIDGK